MTRIKICGITNYDDAKLAADLGADYLGFIVYEKSPRYISIAAAEAIIKQLPKKVKTVGVFVNMPLTELKKIKDLFDVIQLHGDEDMDYINKLKAKKVWKAFRVKDSLEALKNYEVDGYLLDTFSEEKYGGTGKCFDWSLIKDPAKIILSGGIGVDNIGEALQLGVFAVDVNSKVESVEGKKDDKKLRALFKERTTPTAHAATPSKKGNKTNSPSSKGWQAQPDGVVKWHELPYNPSLKPKAKALRKAGNLSEVLFWQKVKNHQFLGLDFDRQKIIGNYIVDFFCRNFGVVIEIDGYSHQLKGEQDLAREDYFKSLGLRVVRVEDKEIKRDLTGVMRRLEQMLGGRTTPTPAAPPLLEKGN